MLLAKRSPYSSRLDINAWCSLVSYSLPPLIHAVRGNPKRATLLTTASGGEKSEKKQIQIIQMLLDARASPNAPGQHGIRPIHVAQTEHVLKKLLEARANVDGVDE